MAPQVMRGKLETMQTTLTLGRVGLEGGLGLSTRVRMPRPSRLTGAEWRVAGCKRQWWEKLPRASSPKARGPG